MGKEKKNISMNSTQEFSISLDLSIFQLFGWPTIYSISIQHIQTLDSVWTAVCKYFKFTCDLGCTLTTLLSLYYQIHCSTHFIICLVMCTRPSTQPSDVQTKCTNWPIKISGQKVLPTKNEKPYSPINTSEKGELFGGFWRK